LHRRLFRCLFDCQQDYAKTAQPDFTEFGGKVALGPREKLSDFDGNLDLNPDPGIFNGISVRIPLYLKYAFWRNQRVLLMDIYVSVKYINSGESSGNSRQSRV